MPLPFLRGIPLCARNAHRVRHVRMASVTLPGTGDKMPQVGYGTWLSAPGEVYTATKVAIEEGYTHIDEAWCYQNEDEVGRAIKEKVADGAVARKDLWVTSKVQDPPMLPAALIAVTPSSLVRCSCGTTFIGQS